MINKKEISIPLTNGVDTKLDEKLTISPNEIVNMFIEKDGVLRKTFGQEALPKDIKGGGTLSEAVYGDTFENDVFINNGKRFYTYIDELSQWKEGDGYFISTLNEKVSAENEKVESSCGYIENDDYYIIIQNYATDSATATVYAKGTDTPLGSANALHIIPIEIGGQIAIVYVSPSAASAGFNSLRMMKVNSLGAFESEIVIDNNIYKRSNGSGIQNLTLAQSTKGTGNYFSYVSPETPNPSVRIIQTDDNGVILNVRMIGTSVTNAFFQTSICENTNGSVEFYYTSAAGLTVNYENLSLDLQTVNGTEVVLSSSDVCSMAAVATDSESGVFIEERSTSGSTLSYWSSINGAYTHSRGLDIVTDLAWFKIGVGAFLYKNRPMLSCKVMSSSGTYNIEAETIIDSSMRIQTLINPLNTETFDAFKEVQTGVFINGDTLKLCYGYGGARGRFATVVTVEFQKFVSKAIEFQNIKFIPNGVNLIYDGTRFFPHGFVGIPNATALTNGGGSVSGTQLYKVVYKMIDNRGNIYRSGPSFEAGVVTSSNTVTITIANTIRTLGLTYKAEVYRAEETEAIYRYVGEVSLSVGDVTYQDSVSDATLKNRQPAFLYTSSGSNGVEELENSNISGSRSVAWHNGRIFSISGPSNVLRHSKKYVIGEGVAFADEFIYYIEDNQARRAQDIIALASLDSKLVIFKENSTLVIYGEGPDNGGNNSDFTDAEIINADVGCIDSRSIVLTGVGVLFQSSKGIYLMGRDLSTKYIGRGIEAYAQEEIIDAELMEDRNVVRFTTKSGLYLIYNTFFQQWTWSDKAELAVSAFSRLGTYGYVDSNAQVYIENQTLFRKDGAFIEPSFNTGWIKLNGIQGFQRVSNLMFQGEYIDDHQLKIEVFYDYENSSPDEYTISPQIGERYQFSVHLRRQKCQAMRVKVTCVDTGATQEGFRISDMTILAGIKKGTNKLPSGSKN